MSWCLSFNLCVFFKHAFQKYLLMLSQGAWIDQDEAFLLKSTNWATVCNVRLPVLVWSEITKGINYRHFLYIFDGNKIKTEQQNQTASRMPIWNFSACENSALWSYLVCYPSIYISSAALHANISGSVFPKLLWDEWIWIHLCLLCLMKYIWSAKMWDRLLLPCSWAGMKFTCYSYKA